jgi:hypothetical protein
VPKKWGKNEAFEHLGATAKHSRKSWSARSADGKTVVVTLWRDGIDYGAKPIVYDTYNRADLHLWKDTFGNRERIENLIWAKAHCDGKFRVVITVAKDVTAYPREIEECYPKDDWVMKITGLDELTGEFRAEKIEND